MTDKQHRYFGVWTAEIDHAHGHAQLVLQEPDKMGQKGIDQLRNWALKTLERDYPDLIIEVQS